MSIYELQGKGRRGRYRDKRDLLLDVVEDRDELLNTHRFEKPIIVTRSRIPRITQHNLSQ
jgi:hypothetical protein